MRILSFVLALLLCLTAPLAMAAPACVIPFGVIVDSPDMCRTWEAFLVQLPEAEGRVQFRRWLMDEPFTPFNITTGLTFFLIIKEHPSVFTVGLNDNAAGVFKPADGGWIFDSIEYAADQEFTGKLPVLRHEIGHWRELVEERKQGKTALTSHGWWHIGHGDKLDPFVMASNAVENWFQQGLPWNHPYRVPDSGLPVQPGTPGALSFCATALIEP